MRSSRPQRGGSSPAALPALLRASHLLGLALGSALGRLRESGATMARLFERAEEQALLLRMTREAAAILAARWDKVPERHRPHYVPEQRFRILRVRSFLGLSQRETAGMFRVSVETIARWEMETTSPDGVTPRPLVAPNPPVRRFADVVRAVVKTMELAGFGGNDLIARTLARAGWKLSARTVGRIRKERWPMPRVPEKASMVPRALRAKRPNHVWMVDLTDVKGLFGIVTFKVAARVLDDRVTRPDTASRPRGPSSTPRRCVVVRNPACRAECASLPSAVPRRPCRSQTRRASR
jgi:DNA-binding transcriptional regulator YiaG